MPDWTDAYYGDLYLDSVVDLLTPRLSELEAGIIGGLLRLGARDRVLDLACGHGRHARVLAPAVGAVVGVDRSAAYLARARGAGAALVRGDVRALPFAAGAFDAAFSWYSSLFMFDDDENARALAEAGRVVRPGGRLLVHHANPLALAGEPSAHARRALPGGGFAEEDSTYDPATGREILARCVVRQGGQVLAATAQLRYYSPPEWADLAPEAGLRLAGITSSVERGEPPENLEPDAPDLIAVLEKV